MAPSLTLPQREQIAYADFSTYQELRLQKKSESQKEHYRQNVIVFGLAWICGRGNSYNDEDHQWLAACTSLGELVIWEVPSLNASQRDCTYPILRTHISDGKLYSIRQEVINGKTFLLVGGDVGLLLFDWERDINEPYLQQQQRKTCDDLTATTQFQPHPSPLETQRKVEINDFQVSLGKGKQSILYAAAGNSFGIYKWDLGSEKLIKNYTSPGGGYLHSLQLVPDGGTLLAGGEAGQLQLWDVHNDKLVDKLDLSFTSSSDLPTAPSSTSSNSTILRTNSKRQKTTPSRWISAISAFDARWFTVAGGNASASAGNNNNRSYIGINATHGGGFLATYYAPTRSLVSWSDTRETPQQLAMLPASLESPIQRRLVSVANEGVVSEWDSMSLERTRRMWCTPPSAYALAVAPNGHTAVAGVGSYIDIFDDSGDKLLRLSILD